MIRTIHTRFFLLLVLAFTATAAWGQVDSVSLKRAMSELDKALIAKDENVLTKLLDDHVSYGHSNGWVQSKSDVINDFKSGKLVYDKLDNEMATVVAITNDWATVRTNTKAEGTVNGNAFQFRLHILQVWKKENAGWKLLARQSTKL